jgi:hypothetical protein
MTTLLAECKVEIEIPPPASPERERWRAGLAPPLQKGDVFEFIQHRKPGPWGQSTIPSRGGQNTMALPVQVRTLLEYWSIGVLECWQKQKPEFNLN